jgi:hypothetical protein
MIGGYERRRHRDGGMSYLSAQDIIEAGLDSRVDGCFAMDA